MSAPPAAAPGVPLEAAGARAVEFEATLMRHACGIGAPHCGIRGCRDAAHRFYYRAHPAHTAGTELCSLDNVTAALAPGSGALTRYVTAVYGEEADPAASSARDAWFARRLRDFVQVLYLEHLPEPLLRACRWPPHPEGADSVYALHGIIAQPAGTLWVYRLPIPPACAHAPNELRMPSPASVGPLRAHERTSPYVEVTHAWADGAHALEGRALWMYMAVGSGLWYKLPAALVPGDVVNVDKAALEDDTRRAQLQTALRARGGADTAVRVRCERFSRAPRLELVSLRRVPLVAPPAGGGGGERAAAERPRALPSDACARHFAGGWPPRPSACACAWDEGGALWPRALSCAGRAASTPAVYLPASLYRFNYSFPELPGGSVSQPPPSAPSAPRARGHRRRSKPGGSRRAPAAKRPFTTVKWTAAHRRPPPSRAGGRAKAKAGPARKAPRPFTVVAARSGRELAAQPARIKNSRASNTSTPSESAPSSSSSAEASSGDHHEQHDHCQMIDNSTNDDLAPRASSPASSPTTALIHWHRATTA